MNNSTNAAKPNSRYQKINPSVIVNLDIGQKITIYPNDDIHEIVQNFCLEHDLDLRCIAYLCDKINQQLDQKNGKQKSNPPSFGVKEDFLQDSFGNPLHLKDHYSQTNLSNQTTNQSISEKNDCQLASRYENWHKIISDKQKSKNVSPRATKKHSITSISKNDSNPNIFDKLYQKGLNQQKSRLELQKLTFKQRSEDELKFATFKPTICPKSKIITRGREDQFPYKQRSQLSTSPSNSVANHKARDCSPIQNDRSDRLKSQWTNFDSQSTRSKSKTSSTNNQNYKQQQEAVRKLMFDSKDKAIKKKPTELKKHEPTRIIKTQSKIQPLNIEAHNQPKLFNKSSLHKEQFYKNTESILYPGTRNVSPSPKQNHSRNPSEAINDFDLATKKIFDLLDEDGDGLISATNLDLSLIDGNILELIAEVLYQMEDEELVFNWQKFRDMCATFQIQEQLIRQANVPQSSKSFRSLF